jgi:uncharacterized protein YndB with AHSA1/START domain
MTPTPTGMLRPDADHTDLVLIRTFRASIDDVWASVTESERLSRWFGSWAGEAGVGRTVTVTMTGEEGDSRSQALIEACEPPHHLTVSTVNEYGTWNLELRLTDHGDTTELTFIHHLSDTSSLGTTGPGWEYYLDGLHAAMTETSVPDFDDYFPAMRDYYELQAGSM